MTNIADQIKLDTMHVKPLLPAVVQPDELVHIVRQEFFFAVPRVPNSIQRVRHHLVMCLVETPDLGFRSIEARGEFGTMPKNYFTDLHAVLSRVEEKASFKLSATLRNVPIDTAVKLLADMAGLTVVQFGNAYYVTSAENAARWKR